MVVKLKLAKPDLFPGHSQNDELPPILQMDGDEKWEVTSPGSRQDSQSEGLLQWSLVHGAMEGL
jgi:hypothetical protein